MDTVGANPDGSYVGLERKPGSAVSLLTPPDFPAASGGSGGGPGFSGADDANRTAKRMRVPDPTVDAAAAAEAAAVPASIALPPHVSAAAAMQHIPGVQVGYVDMCTHTSRCMHACCMHARVNAPTCCCMHNTFYSKRTHSIVREHILCMHARVNAPTCCYLQV